MDQNFLDIEDGGIDDGDVCERCRRHIWKYDGHWCIKANMPEPTTRNNTCLDFEPEN